MRQASDPAAAWARWRAVRDRLFARHPQSPLPPGTREGFRGLDLYPYDPSWRLLGELEPGDGGAVEIATSGQEPYRFRRAGRVRFRAQEAELALDVYWLEGYAGGVFLPFADATSGRATYGAGRYLLDTVKGSDLGTEGGRLVLDFNFSYNPSCAYDPRWVCPLAPPGSRLAVPVEAGEKAPS